MEKSNLSSNQKIFKDMVLGILTYAVVLGFFEDYTNIISTWSYSVTFFVAVVMQLLTYVTFWIKSLIVKKLKGKEGKKYLALLFFSVWMVMFFSKFIFLAVIDSIFGDSVELSGFIGLIIIIATMTIVKKILDWTYSKLG